VFLERLCEGQGCHARERGGLLWAPEEGGGGGEEVFGPVCVGVFVLCGGVGCVCGGSTSV
jgi:hypothetical protein